MATNKNQDMLMLQMSIRLVRDRINDELDGLLEQVGRLLPPADHSRYQRFKNFSAKDWEKYLNG